MRCFPIVSKTELHKYRIRAGNIYFGMSPDLLVSIQNLFDISIHLVGDIWWKHDEKYISIVCSLHNPWIEVWCQVTPKIKTGPFKASAFGRKSLKNHFLNEKESNHPLCAFKYTGRWTTNPILINVWHCRQPLEEDFNGSPTPYHRKGLLTWILSLSIPPLPCTTRVISVISFIKFEFNVHA